MPFGWAAAATAVGAVGTAAIQSNAAGKAAKTAANAQRDAQDQAIGFQRESRDLAREDLRPYMDTGQNALFRAGNASGANGPEGFATALGEFQQSPGYQFAQSEGLRALGASRARAGMASSGAHEKDVLRFSQGLANQEFGAYYNRLLGITQLGQNSAAGVGAQGVQTGNAMAQGALQTGAGIAQTAASAGTAQASIYGNAASTLSNIGNNYANNALYQQQTNALAPTSQQMTAAAAPPPTGNAYGYG